MGNNEKQEKQNLRKIPLSLKRCLSLWEVVVYGVGLILGAGIYVLIGAAAGISGNMLWLSFVLSASIAALTATSYSELSTLFPKAGAEFLYIKAAFGSEALAWLVGIVAVLVGITTASTVAVGFAHYLSMFVDIGHLLLAMGLILFMSLLSFWGIEHSARFNLLATSIEIGGLMIIILVGGFYILNGDIPTVNYLELPQLVDNSSFPLMAVASAAGLIFFAYIGFEEIANIAEEAENPKKILPKAYMYSLVISTIIYVLVAIVAVTIIPYQELGSAEQPLALVMNELIGGQSGKLIALIALFATANTALVTLIVGSRMLYGMAKEDSLPGFLKRIHPKRRTPWIAVIIMGVISMMFLRFESIEVLASFSNIGIFLLFFGVNMSNVALRYRQPDLERPWMAPLNIGKLPVLSVLGALSCLVMLFTIDQSLQIFGLEVSSLVIGLLMFVVPLVVYFVFRRRSV